MSSVILIQSRNNTTSRIPSTTRNSFVYLFVPRSANHCFLPLTFCFYYLLSKTEDNCYYDYSNFFSFFFLSFFLFPLPPYFTMIYRYFSFYFVYWHIGVPGSWWWSEILPGMDPGSLGRQRGLCKGRGKMGSSLTLSCQTQPARCSWGCRDRMQARDR